MPVNSSSLSGCLRACLCVCSLLVSSSSFFPSSLAEKSPSPNKGGKSDVEAAELSREAEVQPGSDRRSSVHGRGLQGELRG